MKKLYMLFVSIVAFSCCSHLVAVREISSEQQFNTVLTENQMVVVDFYMDGCPPCNKLKPVLDALERDFPTIVFVKVNATALNNVATNYNIRGVPVLIFIKDGKEISRSVGYKAKALLAEAIMKAFEL